MSEEQVREREREWERERVDGWKGERETLVDSKERGGCLFPLSVSLQSLPFFQSHTWKDGLT